MSDATSISSEGELDGIPAFVPEGRYLLRFTHWQTLLQFGRAPKLFLNFTICTQGDYFGVEVKRWYNVKLLGRPLKNGRFKAGWSSDLYREYANLVTVAKRNDRIALSRYENLLLIADIATVTHGRDQEKLPRALQYSVVRKLIGVEAGDRAA